MPTDPVSLQAGPISGSEKNDDLSVPLAGIDYLSTIEFNLQMARYKGLVYEQMYSRRIAGDKTGLNFSLTGKPLIEQGVT